jgi:hypothetical protein
LDTLVAIIHPEHRCGKRAAASAFAAASVRMSTDGWACYPGFTTFRAVREMGLRAHFL